MILKYVLCAVLGYLVGTINPSYILAKIRGFDIRKKGSGNAGASNAVIVFGRLVGVTCAVFDILKATLIIWLAGKLFFNLPLVFAITSVACILGHIFPFYMRFRGGKGLACLGGTILAFDWRVFLIMLTCEIVLVLSLKYICFVPMTASVVFPLVYGIMRKDLIGALILLIVTAVIFWKHLENIVRIRKGTEARISGLWNREREIARIQKNSENETTN